MTEIKVKEFSPSLMFPTVQGDPYHSGEVFRKKYKAANQINIDLSEQVSGVYLVALKQGNKTVFKNGYNCITVSNERDIVDILNNQKNIDINKLVKNSSKILEPHLKVSWDI